MLCSRRNLEYDCCVSFETSTFHVASGCASLIERPVLTRVVSADEGGQCSVLTRVVSADEGGQCSVLTRVVSADEAGQCSVLTRVVSADEGGQC
jgi:hypothetical protein